MLAGARLRREFDVVVEHHGGDWVAAGHRVVGEEDQRLAAGGHRHPTAYDALRGQLFAAGPGQRPPLQAECRPGCSGADLRGRPEQQRERLGGEPVDMWTVDDPQPDLTSVEEIARDYRQA